MNPGTNGLGEAGSPSRERLKIRILTLLVLAIGILLTTFVVAIQTQLRRTEQRSLHRTEQAVQRLLKDDQHRCFNTMALALRTLLNDDGLAAALREGNRELLLERTEDLFKDLRQVHGVNHFYFHSAERVNVLRVHNPSRYGDKIDGIVLAAERSGKMESGLESGRLGSFVLRVVAPCVRNGRLLGYVELGVDFEEVIQAIHKELDVDLFLAVDKTVLRRDQWEAAQKQSSWNQFPYVVVTDKTTSAVPRIIQENLRRKPAELAGTAAVIQAQGAASELIFLPLQDASQRSSLQLIVLRDASVAAVQAREALLADALICLPVSAGLIVFFYFFLGRIERALAQRTAKLQDEIAERQAAQRALRETNERLEERVEERTRELQNQVAEREAAQKELLSAQRKLLDASRQAGMAEVATSVLHNVGNVLNSVNVSSALVVEKIRSSRVSRVAKAAALLREHEKDLAPFLTQDPSGQHLPRYLEQLAEHLLSEQREVLEEIKHLGNGIEHIKEIVAMQQSYGKVCGLYESLPVTDLVEDALRVNEAALQRRQVQVQREYSPGPPVLLDKHKVLQILVNLVSNAGHACAQTDRTDKRLIVRVAEEPERVKISVTDNGVGIAPENLARVFSFGFTTRKDGHGFGLHSGALAAKELGGSLRLDSDGLGQGATATLELPLRR